MVANRTCSWKRYSFFEVFAQRFVIIYIWFLFDFKGLMSCNCLDVFIFPEIIWTTSSKALKIMWNVWTIDKEYWSIILNMLWVLGKKNNCEILLKSSKKSLTLYPWEWIASKSLKYQPWVKGLALKALDCQTNVQRSAWRQSSKRVGILLRKRLFLLNTILVNMAKRLWLDIVMNITTYGE